ncbi:MAG: hypothetical protein GXO27_06980 [Chlorobi bacterium]|nr:hypothetical protein [Chlorobiota bacterium]
MKKIIGVMLLVLGGGLRLFAQTTDDVYHYNASRLNGTARYTATAGTISNIGADLSAVADNPAAGAYFVANRISWSPGGFNVSNTAIYNQNPEYSGTASIFQRPFYTNQWGVAIPFVSDTRKWHKVTFGITGRADMHYLNSIEMQGQSAAMQSVTDYFVYQAEGVPVSELRIYDNETLESVYQYLGEAYGNYAQQAFLAYQGYLIDPACGDSLCSEYVSNAAYSNPLYHTLKRRMDGKKFTHDFFVSGEYDRKLALGLSLSIRTMNYDDYKLFAEEGYDPGSTLQYVEYETRLHTEGEGLAFKAGLIYKPVPRVRISVAYVSPTWWKLQETTREGLYSEAMDRDDLDGDGDTSELNVFELYPGVDNIFEEYRYLEPGHWQAGAAYIHDKTGFVSVDYTYRNWAMTRFSALGADGLSQSYFDLLNEEIASVYTAQHRWRAGGELRMQEWALRAGVFYLTSPYRRYPDHVTGGYSFGLGYDFGNVELDLSMLHSQTRYTQQLFPVGLTQTYDVTSVMNRYTFTVRYNF